MITYRLADSLARDAVRDALACEKIEGERRKRLEALLDAGLGSCLLRRPEVARLVIDNWLYFEGVRYQLAAWVVMPNHVHVLVEVIAGYPLSEIVHGWKSFTAKAIARIIGVRGRVWWPDYWDRAVRNEKHFKRAVEYIVENPV